MNKVQSNQVCLSTKVRWLRKLHLLKKMEKLLFSTFTQTIRLDLMEKTFHQCQWQSMRIVQPHQVSRSKDRKFVFTTSKKQSWSQENSLRQTQATLHMKITEWSLIDPIQISYWYISIPETFEFKPELLSVLSKWLWKSFSINSLWPSVSYYFFLQDDIRWIDMLTWLISFGIVVSPIESTPEGNSS